MFWVEVYFARTGDIHTQANLTRRGLLRASAYCDVIADRQILSSLLAASLIGCAEIYGIEKRGIQSQGSNLATNLHSLLPSHLSGLRGGTGSITGEDHVRKLAYLGPLD